MKMGPDLTRRRFGHWTVLARCRRPYYFRCACDCGNTREVLARSLELGTSKSCGCANQEHRKHSGRFYENHLKEYRLWSRLRGFCSNARYPEMGDGPVICDEWFDSFEAFYRDTGDAPWRQALARIDEERPFEPGNTRWIVKRNGNPGPRRDTRWIVYEGERLPLPEASRRLGITPPYVYKVAHERRLDFQAAFDTIRERRRVR